MLCCCNSSGSSRTLENDRSIHAQMKFSLKNYALDNLGILLSYGRWFSYDWDRRLSLKLTVRLTLVPPASGFYRMRPVRRWCGVPERMRRRDGYISYGTVSRGTTPQIQHLVVGVVPLTILSLFDELSSPRDKDTFIQQ